MRQSFDLSVYFIADPSLCKGRDISAIVLEAMKGGVSMVQYRDKESSPEERLEYAKALRMATRIHGMTFIINDYVELAQEVGADGVHLGQDDMSPAEAREILGKEVIIGVTAFTPEHFEALDPKIVDYVGTGPVYKTKTDKGKSVLGPEGLEELINLSSVPVVGVGGITSDNADAVMETGADGVAMMRSISEADDPQAAADKFLNVVAAARLREVS